MLRIIGFILLTSFLSLKGQNVDFEFIDKVYVPTIKSVTFHPQGMGIAAPVSDVEGNIPLLLTFDELTNDVKRFSYKLIHCDFDWRPSELMEMEYINGYPEDNIQQYSFSSKTTLPYVHYELTLPNRGTRWTKSGNYLLIVYEDETEKFPVITKRFVVINNLVQIEPRLVIPANASLYRTHQELDFVVNHPKLLIRQPAQEIKAAVVQNGQWKNAITGISPFSFRNQQIIFDYQGKIVFPGGKEFRPLDLRTLWQRTGQMADLIRTRTSTEVILFKDKLRGEEPYFQNRDINGRFFIETQDQNNQLAADYAQVVFKLYTVEPIYDKDVFLLGSFNDWSPSPEYRMIFSPEEKGYILKKPMKQGFYDYAFATRAKKEEKLDFMETEGSWYETENEYQIFIYYRPFGARYDEVIGYQVFNSRR
ncbi:MAG: DUF5103 domain-containing protein [Saprospiraceae bacterium]|jgi:hypothetical protein